MPKKEAASKVKAFASKVLGAKYRQGIKQELTEKGWVIGEPDMWEVVTTEGIVEVPDASFRALFIVPETNE